ncbi:MAG: DUF6057 family protein [Mediterranea sp.]|jgi:hypothetical protein|nr:DUF6057 family protein [Mediterranea sp.]
MRGRIISITGWGIPLLFGGVAWIFFAIFYRHHLHYQEQLQLFLTTSDYFIQHISRPGGLAIYLGGFFTQFFYDSFAGACALVFMLIVLQRLVLNVSCFISYKPLYGLLTCLPAIVYGALLCNEDILLSGLVALVLSMVAVTFYNRIYACRFRHVYLLLMIPLLYWLVGVACMVFPILCLITEWIHRKETPGRAFLYGITIAAVVLSILSPVVAKSLIPQYPMARFWLAGDYFRFVTDYRFTILYLFLFTAFLPLIIKYLPDKRKKSTRLSLLTMQLLLLIAVTGVSVRAMADWNKEEIMAYDYFSRTKKWNKILVLANKKVPNGPLTVSTLNLALSQTGRLPDYMFTYYQNGVEGLLPSFTKSYVASVMTGEIYYHLGMINTAQSFAFEAMEVIPDYQKSVRCIKRLAETNLINSQYEVAAKYLSILQHTLFYREWATETISYLGDEKRIDDHPEWGVLRRFRPYEDFLFSEEEKDMMFGLLFQHNSSNHKAYEYLLAYTLLTKDLPHFWDYYRMGESQVIYNTTPKSYQEALAYIWSTTEYEPSLKPSQLEEQVVQRLEAYRRIHTSLSNPQPVLKEQFGDTYWYYYYYNK